MHTFEWQHPLFLCTCPLKIEIYRPKLASLLCLCLCHTPIYENCAVFRDIASKSGNLEHNWDIEPNSRIVLAISLATMVYDHNTSDFNKYWCTLWCLLKLTEPFQVEPHSFNYCACTCCRNYSRVGFVSSSSSKRIGAGTI